MRPADVPCMTLGSVVIMKGIVLKLGFVIRVILFLD